MNFASYIKYSDTFIETGTCEGDGIQKALEAGFKKILSVESNYKKFQLSKNRFRLKTFVRLFQGVSYSMLPMMLSGIDKPCVFWLDAHPAGLGTTGHQELLNGNKDFHQDTIITKELFVILAHRNDHVVLIDDVNGVNEFSMKYIKLMTAANNYKYEFIDDMDYKDKVLAFTL